MEQGPNSLESVDSGERTWRDALGQRVGVRQFVARHPEVLRH
jgi:hypothetical protein